MIERKGRVEEEVRKAVALYIEQESNRDALISVTRVILGQKMNHGTVYISVLPESKEQAAIFFLTRNGSDIKNFLKKKIPYLRTMFMDFVIDEGEKNRVRLDELSKEIKNDIVDTEN